MSKTSMETFVPCHKVLDIWPYGLQATAHVPACHHRPTIITYHSTHAQHLSLKHLLKNVPWGPWNVLVATLWHSLFSLSLSFLSAYKIALDVLNHPRVTCFKKYFLTTPPLTGRVKSLFLFKFIDIIKFKIYKVCSPRSVFITSHFTLLVPLRILFSNGASKEWKLL